MYTHMQRIKRRFNQSVIESKCFAVGDITAGGRSVEMRRCISHSDQKTLLFLNLASYFVSGAD